MAAAFCLKLRDKRLTWEIPVVISSIPMTGDETAAERTPLCSREDIMENIMIKMPMVKIVFKLSKMISSKDFIAAVIGFC